MDITFEWDTNKEDINVKKHGISFATAAKIFFTTHYEAKSDRNNESRYVVIGEVDHRILIVVYTKRNGKYRIISARKASKHEEALYKANSELSSIHSSF